MFRGASPVAGSYAESIRCRKRETGLNDSASCTQIFYNLGIGRVHFDATESLLYFVECPPPGIPELLAPVFRGMGNQPVFEQMYLDPHKLLKGAIRLPLLPLHIAPVLAALRLSGVDISIAGQRPDSPEIAAV